MAKILKTLAAIFFLGSSYGVAAQDRAVDDIDGAITFIEQLAEETRQIWDNDEITAEERTSSFRHIFETATDVDLLAKAMLGRHYKSANPEQRTEYINAMRDYIIAEFDKRMQQIGFRELNVTGTTPASGKRGHLFVRTKVTRDDGSPILADWRVRKKNGDFHIVNLEIEGINLLITNRELFSSRVKEVGLNGLITELREASGLYGDTAEE